MPLLPGARSGVALETAVLRIADCQIERVDESQACHQDGSEAIAARRVTSRPPAHGFVHTHTHVKNKIKKWSARHAPTRGMCKTGTHPVSSLCRHGAPAAPRIFSCCFFPLFRCPVYVFAVHPKKCICWVVVHVTMYFAFHSPPPSWVECLLRFGVIGVGSTLGLFAVYRFTKEQNVICSLAPRTTISHQPQQQP